MASKNIEINIKNSIDSSANSDTYTALYPKSLSKNIMYDNDSNVTIQDKLNNLTPNDTFEIGDILCTSKINVDTDKWKLCDGTKLNRDDYPSLFDITNLKNISGLKDITDTLKPADLDLQGWWECNGYYFRYILTENSSNNSMSCTLYRCLKNKNLTEKSNWESLLLDDGSLQEYSLYDIVYLNNYFVVSASYDLYKSDGDDSAYYCYLAMYVINPTDFTLYGEAKNSWSLWYTTSDKKQTYIYKSFPPIYYGGGYHFLTECTRDGHSSEFELYELIFYSSTQAGGLRTGDLDVKNDYVVSYTASKSGFVEFCVHETNVATPYNIYISKNPTGLWTTRYYANYGWYGATDSFGEKIVPTIVQNTNKYIFFNNGDYINDFTGGTTATASGMKEQIINYTVLGSVQGYPYCWNYDNTILYTYYSNNKAFYVYHLEKDNFVLQYSLINTDVYSFNYDSLSPNNSPLKLQDSKYQEMQKGIEIPNITQTVQYKYYIKVQ